MRVTNEQAKIEVMCAEKKDCHECVLNPLSCLDGRGSPEDYAADLIEARELIKKLIHGINKYESDSGLIYEELRKLIEANKEYAE